MSQKLKSGPKKKPDSELIRFITIGVKQANIDKLGGVDSVKVFIESKLKLKV